MVISKFFKKRIENIYEHFLSVKEAFFVQKKWYTRKRESMKRELGTLMPIISAGKYKEGIGNIDEHY